MLTKSFIQSQQVRAQLDDVLGVHDWWDILHELQAIVKEMNSLQGMADLKPDEREQASRLAIEIVEKSTDLNWQLFQMQKLFKARVRWSTVQRLHAQIRRTSCPKPKS